MAKIRIGTGVRICSSAVIMGNGELYIGDDVWIGSKVFISVSQAKVLIGSHVDIAPQVYIGTGTHEIDRLGFHSAGIGINMPITIQDGVWLCARSVILPGTFIGEKTIVAAGSVVKGELLSHSIYAGIPSRWKKEL